MHAGLMGPQVRDEDEMDGQVLVVSFDATGGRLDLLVNDIGTYTGTVRLPDALALEINADGRWTLTAQ